MKNITYITGNQHKADYLASYLGHPIEYKKVDLDELQSMDLKEIIRHKVRQAYDVIKSPVVVEDTSLEFKALGNLPGPFVKFFIKQMPLEDICSLLNGKDRSATARCMYGYFDGENEAYFEGSIEGVISEKPIGDRSFGFGKIFIPKGFTTTQANLNDEDHETMYTEMKPIRQLKEFLEK